MAPEIEAQGAAAANVEGGLPSAKTNGELDLYAVAVLLRAHLRFIVLCALTGFVVMAAYTLYVKPRYEATTTVIVPQGTGSAAGLALQAASGLDLLGGGGFDIYLDILRSRNVAARVIRNDHLQEHWKLQDEIKLEGKLQGETTLASSRDGLLTVKVADEDPQLAATIANSFLTELENVNHQLSVTSAGLQRKYFEEQMTQEKNALEDAEVTLELSQQKSGTLEPQMQAQASLSASEGVRAQLREKKVELQALLQGDTMQNPQVQRVQAEIAQLEGQLGGMQTGGGVAEGQPSSKAPAQQLAFLRASREVKFHEALFAGLQRQDEIFKQQEAKNYPQLEVLDVAEAPKVKSWPPRTRYSLAGLFLGLLLGVAWTLLRALQRTVLSNPVNRLRYEALVSGRKISGTHGMSKGS